MRRRFNYVEKSAKSEEELFEIVTDAGAEDLRDDEDSFEIITAPSEFDAVLGAVKGAGVEPQVAEVEMVAKEYKKLEGAEARQMLKLMEALEDHDDVKKSQQLCISEAIWRRRIVAGGRLDLSNFQDQDQKPRSPSFETELKEGIIC